jgi:hypothetical protein
MRSPVGTESSVATGGLILWGRFPTYHSEASGPARWFRGPDPPLRSFSDSRRAAPEADR